MVLLHCRECGTEIASDTRQTKCTKCGTLFPFACAVCHKLLRPPIPDFPIERYFTTDHQPLCEDHYQRQCPECQKWFQADENPGYYLCPECTAKRPPVPTTGATFSANGTDEDYVLARNDDDDEVDGSSRRRSGARTAQADGEATGGRGCGLGMLVLAVSVSAAYLGLHALAAPLLHAGR